MRKNAGFMLMTLLLLVVPALANAWTLTVRVTGGNDNNSVAVTYPASSDRTKPLVVKTIKRGTAYLYPTRGGVALNVGGPGHTITLDGGARSLDTLDDLTSGNHVIEVNYVADDTAGLTLEQAAEGGTIYARNRNSTWNSTGVTGLPCGTLVPITIAADANHRILGYTLDHGTVTVTEGMAIFGTPGEVVTFTLEASGQSIKPVFAVYGKVSATLSAPTDGVAGRPITFRVTATTNSDPSTLAYYVIINGTEYPAPEGVFTLSNPVKGIYTVRARVTSANGGAFTTAPVTVAVADAMEAANSECTSCHSSSFPRVVKEFKASVHSRSEESTCQACHVPNSEVTPHSAGINHTTVNPTTFSSADNAIFCVRCHQNYSASHTAPSKNNPNCSTCHLSVHNPNPILGGAIQFKQLPSIGTDTVTVSTLTNVGDFNYPKGITTDGANLYIADHGANVIRKVVIATGEVSILAGSGDAGFRDGPGNTAMFDGPEGVTTDGTNLYVCDTGSSNGQSSGNSKIRKVVIATGAVSTVTEDATLDYPYSITTDGTTLFVTEYFEPAIHKVSLAKGTVETIQTEVPFNVPSGITTDGTKLYVTDQDNNIFSVVIETGEVSTIVNNGLATPAGITTDGTNLYFADLASHTIRKVNLSDNTVTTIAGTEGVPGNDDGPGGVASFDNPFGITTDGVNLYVTDYGSKLIRKLAPVMH